MSRTSCLALLVAWGLSCGLVRGEDAAVLTPLDAQQAAAGFAVPEGFRTILFAAEPQVTQPIAFTTDARGRLWVVECLSYPDWRTDGTGADRVVILEDTDGDGRCDKRTVFLDNGSNLSGIAWGLGGVWLCATPDLFFVADRDGDDVPDGPPETVLDGWDLKARHNVFNGLTFGPDGWLYGCNGILSNSLVGPPGASDDERTRLNCGVWRYHPTRREFEVVAHGTTNPWGLDFDAQGRMFITNCVIEHVFHVLPGAHYKRMFGQDLNPYVYSLMETCADHIHWGGGFWDTSIGGIHNAYGGGHAHAGAMIYLGDNWPDEYRGNLFTINIHGQRLNRDTFRPAGSGVVASHAPDFAQSSDPWFRGLEMLYGPDGGVYVTDWNDVGECHDYDDVERDTGRIFKIVYGTPPFHPVDLMELDDAALVELQRHRNEWHARTARLILQQHATERPIDRSAVESLQDMLNRSEDPLLRLRALWTLAATGNADASVLDQAARDPDEHVRAWGIRLELEDRAVTRGTLLRLVEQARTDPSPVVRLELASALQRLTIGDRVPVARELLRHGEDADDRQLPLMIWYGIEPLAGDREHRDLALLESAAIPLTAQHLARRIASHNGGIDRLVNWLAGARSNERIAPAVLYGLRQAVEGRRDLPMPRNWNAAKARFQRNSVAARTREAVQFLSLSFGDEETFEWLTRIAGDTGRSDDERLQALELLVQVPDPRLVPLLHRLLNEPDIAGPALRGLSAYEDAGTPDAIIQAYAGFSRERREEAIATLAARRPSAARLLDAVEAGTIPVSDISAYVARQLLDYDDPGITERVRRLWGNIQATSAEKVQRMAEYRAELVPESLAAADLEAGRRIFTAKCAQCHRLFGEGATIGPDLTGAQRTNIDYLLQHIVDPSAAVPREYAVHIVLTTDGRLMHGVVPEENQRVVVLQTPTERLVLDRGDIEEMKGSSQSMMPEGLLEGLTPAERRDLIAYLSRSNAPASE